MSSASRASERQFVENAPQYANTNPEKFNLYHGLAGLAAAIEVLEDKIDLILQQLSALQRERR